MSSELSGFSDAELTALALAGRQDAYSELLKRHRERVFRLVRAATGDPTEALDITQDVFISAFASLTSFDTARSFPIWLRRIALNKTRDWARRRRVRAFFTRAAPLEDAGAIADDSVPADVQAADIAELARVSAAISRLPGPLREVLLLRTVDGFSQAETAEVIGVNGKTVETRLHRARARLRNILSTK